MDEEDSDSGNDSLNAEANGPVYNERLWGKAPGASENPPIRYDYGPLFTDGLQQLQTELEQKYMLDSIETVLYALAVNINCLNSCLPDPGEKPARCLLADHNIIFQEFQAVRDFTFYPLAFYLAYRNFSLAKPPAFLTNNLLAVMQENMSYQHNRANVLNYRYFQGYSNIKRSICYRPNNLLTTKGVATAALALSDRNSSLSTYVAARRERLLRRLRGQWTPADPESSKLFACEQQRIEQAIVEDEFAFQIEQVLSVQVF
jgi:hypothetical protein